MCVHRKVQVRIMLLLEKILFVRKDCRSVLQMVDGSEELGARYYCYHACLCIQTEKSVKRECNYLYTPLAFRSPRIPLLDQT
jgi:hypothetical protein